MFIWAPGRAFANRSFYLPFRHRRAPTLKLRRKRKL